MKKYQILISALVLVAVSCASILFGPVWAIFLLVLAAISVALAAKFYTLNGKIDLISEIGVGILLTDHTGKVRFCNDDACELLGLKRNYVEDSNAWIQIADQDCRFRLKNEIRNAKSAKKTGGIELRLVRADGSARDVLVNVIHQSRSWLRAVCMTDITQRKMVMEVLREREELMDNVLETIDEGLAAFDRDYNVTHWNAGMSRITGLAREMVMLVDDPMDVINREFPLSVNESIKLAMQGKETVRNGVYSPRESKEPMHLNVNYRPLRSPSGAITGVLCTARDITTSRKVQDEILESKELAESANAAKSEFLANISHELRTPMNGIIGLINLTMQEGLSSQQQQWLSMAQTASESLTSVINNILDYSRMETSGTTELNVVPFSPISCAGETMVANQQGAEAKNISIRLEINGDIPDVVYGDVNRVRQVLGHLVENAVKFSDSGEICISVTAGEISDGKLECVFSVSDQGVGVPKEKIQTIFEPFIQADGSSTRKYNGTGLGLSICRRIVEQFGGRIWLESELGQGSSFFFSAVFDTEDTDATETCSEPQSIDMKACLSRLGGDMDLLREIAVIFLEEAPVHLDTIEQALQNNDMSAAAAEAHSFKGSVGNFQATKLMEKAKMLELEAKDDNLESCKLLLEEMRGQTKILLAELEAMFVASN